jgi:alpha-glucosidase (family GH31 glycosyl hydrolase)
MLNFGLSGQPMAGHDVGGFATSSTGGDANGTGANGVTDPELMARWTTVSAFIARLSPCSVDICTGRSSLRQRA